MFCFDANYHKKEYVTYEFENYDYENGGGTYDFSFEGYAYSYDAQLRETKPSLYCNLPKDGMNSWQTRLTAGNGQLSAPIATITMDEAIMAGMSTSGNSRTYLPGDFVTMTPYQNNMLTPGAGGNAVTNGAYGTTWLCEGNLCGLGIYIDESVEVTYPVINLKADYAREFIWDATQNAYVHP